MTCTSETNSRGGCRSTEWTLHAKSEANGLRAGTGQAARRTVRSVEEAGGGLGAGQRDAQRGGFGKLLSPPRRRQAVAHLRGQFGVSERRACRVVGHPRSTHRRQVVVPEDEPRLVDRMIELATTYGGRRGGTLRTLPTRTMETGSRDDHRDAVAAPLRTRLSYPAPLPRPLTIARNPQNNLGPSPSEPGVRSPAGLGGGGGSLARTRLAAILAPCVVGEQQSNVDGSRQVPQYPRSTLLIDVSDLGHHDHSNQEV